MRWILPAMLLWLVVRFGVAPPVLRWMAAVGASAQVGYGGFSIAE
ncbi:MAG TPA: hypothetical protein VE913_08655 [Longimicrobium sp.]|nr:hypothetical protein [Longimicrobium sp.]